VIGREYTKTTQEIRVPFNRKAQGPPFTPSARRSRVDGMNRCLRCAAVGLVAGLTVTCARQAPPEQARRFELRGQVLSIQLDRNEITIHHEDIPGFMPAMTMPFRARNRGILGGLEPGDLVRGTLVVLEDDAYLEGLERTGHAALPVAAPAAPEPGIPALKPGEAVPDQTFIDQDGREVRFSSFAGSAVVLTFIYTRCPLPDYCPRMDRQFGALQAAIRSGRVRAPVKLVSVSFDPAFDTPAVLRQHAAAVGADATIWSFLTADRKVVDEFGARFGLSVLRGEKDPADITHNLRTAVIDAHGRLVRVYDGNRWTPADITRDLASLAPT
jgi:protein SCO1/2